MKKKKNQIKKTRMVSRLVEQEIHFHWYKTRTNSFQEEKSTTKFSIFTYMQHHRYYQRISPGTRINLFYYKDN